MKGKRNFMGAYYKRTILKAVTEGTKEREKGDDEDVFFCFDKGGYNNK